MMNHDVRFSIFFQRMCERCSLTYQRCCESSPGKVVAPFHVVELIIKMSGGHKASACFCLHGKEKRIANR